MHLKIKGILFICCCFITLSGYAQCNQPTGISIDNITSVSARLNWSASVSAPGVGYQYEIRTSGIPGTVGVGLVNNGSAGDDTFTSAVSGLTSNTTYHVYMRYQCSLTPEFSSWTTALTFVTSELQAPIAGTPAGLSDTFFTARWIAVPGASGYRLDVSTENDFSVLLPGYDNLLVTGISKLVSDLEPGTTYYYRVRAEGNSGIGLATSQNSNEVMVITLDEPSFVAVWTINGWLEGIEPTAEYDVILDYHYVSDENNISMVEVKSLTLNEGYTFTLTSGFYLTVYENIINLSTPDSFVVESNANLYQLDDFAPANIGEITVKRTSSEIFRLDYTIWSSPVTGTQTLKQFSPQTVNNRFYNYNTISNNFSITDPLTTVFNPGRGYLIRAANNHVANNGTNSPQSWQGVFVGVPTNGEVSVGLNTNGEGYNMVGNPYPTILSADEFIFQNVEFGGNQEVVEANSNFDGTLHFWRRRNNPDNEGDDIGTYYATYTIFGGVGVEGSVDSDPNGFIQVGQGFLVKALSPELNFNSLMKIPDNFDNQFFRMAPVEKHRIWLNLTNTNGVFSKMLVGYANGASNGEDGLDGRFMNDSGVALTSLINNAEYTIQAKSLPFQAEDIIPLGFKVVTAGNYTIAIDHVDGIFEAGQLVYLEDTFTSTVHNLNESAYTFSTEAGDFKTRFVLRFTEETMSVEQPLNAAAVAVLVKDNTININTGNILMQSLTVFDVQGRKLLRQDQVNASEFIITTLSKNNQVLVLQIKDENSNVVTKKLVF